MSAAPPNCLAIVFRMLGKLFACEHSSIVQQEPIDDYGPRHIEQEVVFIVALVLLIVLTSFLPYLYIVIMDIFRVYLDWLQQFAFYQSSPVGLTRYWTGVCSRHQTEIRPCIFRWPRSRMRLSVVNALTDAEYARRYMPFYAGVLRVDPFSLQSSRVMTRNEVVSRETIKHSLNNPWMGKDDLDFLIQACGSLSNVDIVEIEIYSAGTDTTRDPPLDLSPLLGSSVRNVVLISCPVVPRTIFDAYATTNVFFSGDHASLRSIHFGRAQTVKPAHSGTVPYPPFIKPYLSDGTRRQRLCVSSSVLSCRRELNDFRKMVKQLKDSGVRVKMLHITLNIKVLDKQKDHMDFPVRLPSLRHCKTIHFTFWQSSHWKNPESHPVVRGLISRNCRSVLKWSHYVPPRKSRCKRRRDTTST